MIFVHECWSNQNSYIYYYNYEDDIQNHKIKSNAPCTFKLDYTLIQKLSICRDSSICFSQTYFKPCKTYNISGLKEPKVSAIPIYLILFAFYEKSS